MTSPYGLSGPDESGTHRPEGNAGPPARRLRVRAGAPRSAPAGRAAAAAARTAPRAAVTPPARGEGMGGRKDRRFRAGFQIEPSGRIRTLPPYLFAAIDEMKQKAIARGVDIINLGIGDPDLPTPAPIVEQVRQAVGNPKYHQYPSYEGMLSFRQAVADWYQRRFGVPPHSAAEVLTLIGSKEGIGHVPLAFVDHGDVVLVPSPGDPVYPVGTSFAGGTPYVIPLTKAQPYLPDLRAIPKDVARKAKLKFLYYSNNPTSATAGKDFFKRVVEFASEHRIIVCHDAAYSEIYYDGRRPPSFLEAAGAKEVGVG